jgi:predicted methyltransferase
MLRVTDMAQLIVRNAVKPGAFTIDATVGNGHDTLFLAELVGPSGTVIGFDIQAPALHVAQQRLVGFPQVTLVHAGHERLAELLPAPAHGKLSAVMFNLGYLPGAAKAIITQSGTTLQALTQALDHLTINGVVTLILYPAHPGGADEAAHVTAFAAQLPAPYAVTASNRTNATVPAPSLLIIERTR